MDNREVYFEAPNSISYLVSLSCTSLDNSACSRSMLGISNPADTEADGRCCPGVLEADLARETCGS
jgi:hypothetical protein